MNTSSTSYISEKRVMMYSVLAVYLIAIFMLVAPLWILSLVNRPNVKLAVITVFLVLFLTVLSLRLVLNLSRFWRLLQRNRSSSA
jgi:hypothetical protein